MSLLGLPTRLFNTEMSVSSGGKIKCHFQRVGVKNDTFKEKK